MTNYDNLSYAYRNRADYLNQQIGSQLYYIHRYYHDGSSVTCEYCVNAKKSAKKLADIQKRIDNAPAPRCSLCGDKAPFGDERNYWIGYHHSWYHKLYYKLKRFFLY